MKNKMVAILGAAVIIVGTIGGVAFASDKTSGTDNSLKVSTQENNGDKNQFINNNGYDYMQQMMGAIDREEIINDKPKYNKNSANNKPKGIYKDMIQIMRDNAYKDMARYMQIGDYEAMNEFMDNMTEEDYDKMIDIMNNNGYGYMGQMMESIGREEMIEMHNSMSGMHGSYGNRNNMMSGF